MSVVQFKQADTDPHVSGDAKCLSCKHKWVAVAPIEAVWLECPNCSLERGRFYYHFEPDEHWECACGNDLFYSTYDGMVCPSCGDFQEYS